MAGLHCGAVAKRCTAAVQCGHKFAYAVQTSIARRSILFVGQFTGDKQQSTTVHKKCDKFIGRIDAIEYECKSIAYSMATDCRQTIARRHRLCKAARLTAHYSLLTMYTPHIIHLQLLFQGKAPCPKYDTIHHKFLNDPDPDTAFYEYNRKLLPLYAHMTKHMGKVSETEFKT